eukprot:6198208-Pleurochrysis_carterae.AAC.2
MTSERKSKRSRHGSNNAKGSNDADDILRRLGRSTIMLRSNKSLRKREGGERGKRVLEKAGGAGQGEGQAGGKLRKESPASKLRPQEARVAASGRRVSIFSALARSAEAPSTSPMDSLTSARSRSRSRIMLRTYAVLVLASFRH